MTLKELIEWYESWIKWAKEIKNTDVDMHELYSDTLHYLQMVSVSGCEGCVFEKTEEWEMPCVRCKRCCKDYWRAKETNTEALAYTE